MNSGPDSITYRQNAQGDETLEGNTGDAFRKSVQTQAGREEGTTRLKATWGL